MTTKWQREFKAHNYLYTLKNRSVCECLHSIDVHDDKTNKNYTPCTFKDCACEDFTRRQVQIEAFNIHQACHKLDIPIDDCQYVYKVIL